MAARSLCEGLRTRLLKPVTSPTPGRQAQPPDAATWSLDGSARMISSPYPVSLVPKNM